MEAAEGVMHLETAAVHVAWHCQPGQTSLAVGPFFAEAPVAGAGEGQLAVLVCAGQRP